MASDAPQCIRVPRQSNIIWVQRQIKADVVKWLSFCEIQASGLEESLNLLCFFLNSEIFLQSVRYPGMQLNSYQNVSHKACLSILLLRHQFLPMPDDCLHHLLFSLFGRTQRLISICNPFLCGELSIGLMKSYTIGSYISSRISYNKETSVHIYTNSYCWVVQPPSVAASLIFAWTGGPWVFHRR